MIISLIIPVFSYILQAWPRILKKNFGVDVWTRLLETDHLRRNNHRVPHEKLGDKFIIDGYFDYPPLFPTLLSFIPKKTLLKYEGFIAPLFDSIQVLAVYFIALFITNSPTIALISQGMYALTPMIVLENSYLTPRSFGYLNFTLALTPLLLFYVYQLPIFLYSALIFTTLIFLTHRFATQSLLFASVFFSLYLQTPLFISIFLIGFVLATLLTKRYYLRVLKGHISNIYFWVKNLDYRFAHQVRGLQVDNKQSDWVALVYKFMSVFSPIAVFGLNPWALSGFVAMLLVLLGLLELTPVLSLFMAWILFFYFFGVVVLKSKYLMPIGEGQRYMEMATVPAAILSAVVFLRLHELFGSFAILGLVALGAFNIALILFVQIKGVLSDTNRSLTQEMSNLFAFINSQKKPVRIICIPHQNTTLVLYHTKASVLVNADNPGLLQISDFYPILKMPLHELAKKYNLTHAIIRTGFASLKELGLKKGDVVFSEKEISLVRLSKYAK